MPFATIAGITYQVQNPGATENATELIGQVRRTFLGGARNSVRAEARAWSMTLAPILNTDYLTLVANVKNRKFVNVTGDFLAGTTVLCWVEISSAQYLKPNVTSALYRIVALDIHEVDPAVALLSPTPYYFLLTSAVSPDDPAAQVTTPDWPYVGDFESGATMGVGLVPTAGACPAEPPIVFSSASELSFLSVPLDNGYVFGKPTVLVEAGGMDPTVWGTGSMKAKLYLKRAGVLVAGPWESNYVGNFGLLGVSNQDMLFTDTISLNLIAGDQFLLEFWVRIGLRCGFADNGDRPFMYTGHVAGPRRSPGLVLSGDITVL